MDSKSETPDLRGDAKALLSRAAAILDQSMISVYVLRRTLHQRRGIQTEVAQGRSALRKLRKRLAAGKATLEMAV
jgi:hypothetical protein